MSKMTKTQRKNMMLSVAGKVQRLWMAGDISDKDMLTLSKIISKNLKRIG